MKLFVIYFLSIFFLQFGANAFALSQPPSNVNNLCPQQIVVAIDCPKNQNDFQLLRHLGKYTGPKMELTPDHRQMICSYGASEWISKYIFRDMSGEKTIIVSSLYELSSVADMIRQMGFNLGRFSKKTLPFTMVTYRQDKRNYTPDQMFLYSGLESTFGEGNLSMADTDDSVSTMIINERYLKSQNAAADTYVTGSNCIIAIK